MGSWGTSEWTLFAVNVLAVFGNSVVAIWLKGYVKQKEELKDTEISNIRTIIEAKDAHIENLNQQNEKLAKETAPSLVTHVKNLSETIESMAKTLQDEKKKYDELISSTKDSVALITDLPAKLREQNQIKTINDLLRAQVSYMRETLHSLQQDTLSLPSVYIRNDGTAVSVAGGVFNPLVPEGDVFRMRAIDTSRESPIRGVNDLPNDTKSPKHDK
jgi:chromosome segregation ATPase